MCRICESAGTVRDAARKLTHAIAEAEAADAVTPLTGNRTGLRRSRRFPVDRSSPPDMQQLLARIQTPPQR